MGLQRLYFVMKNLGYKSYIPTRNQSAYKNIRKENLLDRKALLSVNKEPQPQKSLRLNNMVGSFPLSYSKSYLERKQELQRFQRQRERLQREQKEKERQREKERQKQKQREERFYKFAPLVSLQKDRGLCGLQNIGNTCFLNSTLQCLFNLTNFNQQLKSERSSSDVTYSYINLYQKTRESSFAQSTYQLKRAISKKTHMFTGYSQQDAHQFLITLLNSMHQQVNRVPKKLPYKELKSQSHLSRQQNSQIWWRYMRKIDDSSVYDFFNGQILSQVVCDNCGNESLTFQQFLNMELNLKSSYSNSLTDLIKDFCSQQKVHSYKCDKQNKLTRCRRRLSFWRLPQLLVIHLKRFQYGTYTRRKLDYRVSYPKTIDLAEFVSQSTHQSTKRSKYSLCGMIKHSGSIDGGHYTADCKLRSGKWYEFNDRYVRQTQLSQSGSAAYILFYQRQ